MKWRAKAEPDYERGGGLAVEEGALTMSLAAGWPLRNDQKSSSSWPMLTFINSYSPLRSFLLIFSAISLHRNNTSQTSWQRSILRTHAYTIVRADCNSRKIQYMYFILTSPLIGS